MRSLVVLYLYLLIYGAFFLPNFWIRLNDNSNLAISLPEASSKENACLRYLSSLCGSATKALKLSKEISMKASSLTLLFVRYFGSIKRMVGGLLLVDIFEYNFDLRSFTIEKKSHFSYFSEKSAKLILRLYKSTNLRTYFTPILKEVDFPDFISNPSSP